MSGSVAVDLDGTLAEYHGWKGPGVIGAPIPMMVERVKYWILQGVDVQIFTARATEVMNIPIIQRWLTDVAYLPLLPITCVKTYDFVEFWDDRAIDVVPNAGKPLSGTLYATMCSNCHWSVACVVGSHKECSGCVAPYYQHYIRRGLKQ